MVGKMPRLSPRGSVRHNLGPRVCRRYGLQGSPEYIAGVCEPQNPWRSELWRAVEVGDVALVARLLREGADPEERYQGWTPLMKAAVEDHTNSAILLLNADADIEKRE